MKLDVGPGGALAWLPQETILFDRARLRRTIDVDLAPTPTCLLAEAVVFGRSAMGETVRSGQFFDRWRVRVDGALVFAETIRLDGAIAQRLAQRGDRGAAAWRWPACSSFPAMTKRVAAVRAMQQRFCRRSRRLGLERACASRAVSPPTARRCGTISSPC